jgi:hypothetical protein
MSVKMWVRGMGRRQRKSEQNKLETRVLAKLLSINEKALSYARSEPSIFVCIRLTYINGP